MKTRKMMNEKIRDKREEFNKGSGGSKILLGVIVGVHGIGGQVRIRSFTSAACAIGDYGTLLGDNGNSYELSSVRAHKKDIVIASIAGVTDRNTAETLVGVELFIGRENLADAGDADSYYHVDLIGLSVFSTDGAKILGEVMAVYNYGGGDLLEIRLPGGGDILLLFSRANVDSVTLGKGEGGIYLSPVGMEALDVGR